MKKIRLSILLTLLTLFVHAQTDEAEVVRQQLDEALLIQDFLRASKLINDTQTKLALGDEIFIEYCFNISTLAQDSTTTPQDRYLIETSILELSQDSVFQINYINLFFEKKEYSYLFGFIDQLLEKYPEKKNFYNRQKGALYLSQDNYLKAKPIYEELMKTDKDNGFVYMDIGYYGMKYAEKIYNNGEEYDYINDGTHKNKKDALPYFRKAIKNMLKAYNLFTDDERCNTHVLVFLNDLCSMLLEEEVISRNELDFYIKKIDTSEYYCN